MQSLFHRALMLQSAGGLLLVLGGSAAFVTTAPDSWIALVALLAHFCGLMLLYSAIRVWMVRFGGRSRFADNASRGALQGCGIALVRMSLVTALVAGAGFWLWFAAVDLNEVRLLLFEGRQVTAQVIGRALVPAKAPVGYIHYAYRISPTLAPPDRFAVPHGDYPRYRIGQQFLVTYVPDAPRVHRIGRVDWSYALRRLLYWLLLLPNGAAYLYLPLWLLEFRRRPAGNQTRRLADPAHGST